MILSYLKKLITKSNFELSKNISMDKFNFLPMDKINIFLINQSLEEKNNLWLNVNNQHLNNLYEPIIFISAVHFFTKNYCEDKKIKPKLGDEYKKGKYSYEVIEIDCKIEGIKNGTKLKCIDKKNPDSTIITELKGNRFIKVKKNGINNNRNTFKSMLDFLDKTLGEKESIPSFPHKFAIVASKKDFESSFKILDKKAFPYTYITCNDHKKDNLASEDSMFFVASDYNTIQESICDKGIKIETVIFIGDKYNALIQQDLDRDYLEQVIFVGEKKPEVKHLKWRWTLPEYQELDNLTQNQITTVKVGNKNLTQNQITTVKVENESLTKLITNFINNIKQLEQNNNIKLQCRILPFISYIYPLVVLTDHSRLKNRVDDLSNYFPNILDKILGEEFSNIGKDYKEIYKQLVNDYKIILDQLYFKNNAKTRVLREQKSTEYLLVPERQTVKVWQQEIQELNWKKVKVISLSELKKLEKQSIITVLSLQDYNFYCSIRDNNHKVNWLLYDNEYEQYQNFAIRYDNELIKEYTSVDRKTLTNINYSHEIKKESINELVTRIWHDNTTDSTKEYHTSYQDLMYKKITFTDGHQVELSTNSTVILCDNISIKYKVSDLKMNDQIRVYENKHKEVLFDIISKNNKDFKKILDNSQLWKQILKKYCEHNQITKINKIAKLCNILPTTVEGWIKENSKTKFPKNIKPLNSILGDNFFEIHCSNKKYNNILIALGRNLSEEVSDYLIHKKIGAVLSEFEDLMIKDISNSNMPIRTIKAISNIDIVIKPSEEILFKNTN